MSEAEETAVQRLPFQSPGIATTAVERVSDQRVAQPCHMNPNLVSSTRMNLHVDMGKALPYFGKGLDHLIFRDRRLAARMYGHSLAVHLMAGDGLLDATSLCQGHPVDQSLIEFADLTLLKLQRQTQMSGIRLGHHHDPGRVLVEPVYDAGLLNAANAGKVLAVGQQGIDQSTLAMRAGRMNHQAFVLIEHQQVGILIENLQWDLFSLGLGRLQGRYLDEDLLARLESRGGLARATVEQDASAADPILDEGARAFRQLVSQVHVQAQAIAARLYAVLANLGGFSFLILIVKPTGVYFSTGHSGRHLWSFVKDFNAPSACLLCLMSIYLTGWKRHLLQPTELSKTIEKAVPRMAGSINPGFNPSLASVPVSKYISNATHVGATQQVGKEAAKVKDEPARDTAQTRQPATAQATASAEPAGVQQKTKPDGSLEFTTESGVVMNTDSEGKITKIDIPGDGQIERKDEQMVLTTANGKQLPVQPFQDEQGMFLGYSFVRPDDTKVYVNLDGLSVAYEGKHGDIWQEVDSQGGQTIFTDSTFKDPKTGQKSQIRSHVYVHPDGKVEHIEGYNKGLKVSGGKIEFRSPADFPTTIELPNPLNGGSKPTPRAESAVPPQGPVLQEDPSKPAVHANLPSFTLFHRDEFGQTAITLRNDLSVMDTAERTLVSDSNENSPTYGQKWLAETEMVTSADGRSEKMLKFKDGQGNQYRLFNESMDFLVDSPDGKVRQHVLPNGTILGQVEGENGKFYRFEVTPQGQYKTDPGLSLASTALGDAKQATIKGADGQAQSVALPYAIPFNQAAAAHESSVFGTPSYPTSGQILPAFQGGETPPAPPEVPPQQPGGPTTPPPLPPQDRIEPTILPHYGQPQQPVQPGFFQRLKYTFSGNPAHLQSYSPPPPPWMSSYPQQGYDPMSGYYTGGYDPALGGYPPNGDMPPGGAPQGPPPNPNPGGPPSYPSQQATPGFTGQAPGGPGQVPSAEDYLERLKRENAALNAANWAAASHTPLLNMMIGMTALGEMQLGMGMMRVMFPGAMFFNPFCFF